MLVKRNKTFALRYQYTPNDNLALSLFHGRAFHKTPNKVYIFWKLNNCRFRLLLEIRQEIKPFPKIAIISQKYVVSQIEFVSGQNLTGESERHRYVFFTPWSKKRCRGILITCLVCFLFAVKLQVFIKHPLPSLKY